jgi:L-rhamnose-H+ transport protein
MTGSIIGVVILAFAGIMNASFTLPMKYARRWSWENTWLAWTLIALVLLPIGTTYAALSRASAVYESAGVHVLRDVFLFGAGWGIAQVLFGLAVDAIGIALTFSLVLGTSAGAGTVLPLIRLHPKQLGTAAGHGVLGGVFLVIAGVLVCAVAGKLRENIMKGQAGSVRKGMVLGIALAVLCGLGASLMNLGVAYGAPLIKVARAFGANDFAASNAIWMPLMLGGAIPNILYCLWLLRKNGSQRKFTQGGASHWAMAFVMAILWFGSTVLYGLSAVQMGAWGPILGWPLFMSLIVIAASLLGMFTGEWKGSGSVPLRIQWAGVTLLVLAVFILAETSRYLS